MPELRDLQMPQQQNYPTIDVNIDRARAGTMDLSVHAITNALIPSTSSSRYVAPNYWRDPKTGQAYIVEASTDLIHWQAIGTATDRGEDVFEFEDAAPAGVFPRRFYRIIER